MNTVFIDGSYGTTGLEINARLAGRDDIALITLSEEEKKDVKRRKEALNSCDTAILCLPDGASVEACGMIDNPRVKVIDASTAHRIKPGWVYGFPEIDPEVRKKIAKAKRVAVTGCHAGGFVSLVYPLVKANILREDATLACYSLTGYTGGGKAMIASYENENRNESYASPRCYALGLDHKHLPEMQYICGLKNKPLFLPVVADFPRGMLVSVPIFASFLNSGKSFEDIRKTYASLYTGKVVSYREEFDSDGFMAANALAGRDNMEISMSENGEQAMLFSRFDNLGKGACGCAVQLLNIMNGCDETCSLIL